MVSRAIRRRGQRRQSDLWMLPQVCPASHLNMAYKAVKRVFENEFRASPLTSVQFAILVHLSLYEPISSAELAERLGSDPSTVSRNMDALEDRNLVDVKRGEDRRERVYRLADTGRRILDDTVPIWRKAQHRVLRQVGRGEWQRALRVLRRIQQTH